MGIVARIIYKWDHYCRLWNYRRKGVTFGKHSQFKNAILGEYSNLAHHAEVSNCSIGSRTSIGRYSKVQYAEIGKYCSISWDVTIGALGHPLHSVSSHAFSYKKRFNLCKEDTVIKREKVFIGNDVWIGCGVIVMPGVHIGDGAVIGAGAIVTHNVASYEIVAGVPAKHIKWRFDEDVRKTLLEIKWWDWDDEVIRNHIELFSPENDITDNSDIVNALKMIKDRIDS